MRSFVCVAAIAAVIGLAASTASAVVIPTVPIGNPNNAFDYTGFGSVAYTYRIGQTEVTNAQYVEFLNAKAASDPFDLYNTNMAGVLGGITRSGTPGSYTYSTVSSMANHPVNHVSSWDAARFANWLHNGQGTGDTETGAYTLTPGGISADTVTRNPGALWAISTRDEWYKAAYHQPSSQGGDWDNYWDYPTSSNFVPGTSHANILFGLSRPVATYAANYYGTFDMGGNVREISEMFIAGFNVRTVWGGSSSQSAIWLRSTSTTSISPSSEDAYTGFRVVQVPGPTSVALLGLGGVMVARRRTR